jgi:CHASE2 domain-containing sensor protein
MNKTLIYAGISIYLALWASPVIIAHWRNHPRRWAITLIAGFAGLVCPLTLPCLIWACWPKAKVEPPVPAQTYDSEFFRDDHDDYGN